MKHNWEYKRLGDICDLYQPKTIAASELVEDGEYDVYGANGIIGKFTRYNHEFPEILLTCRGATCGTINISNPKSWINGNAMVIHSKSSELLFAYLKYAMTALDYSNIITGAAQPQITRQSLTPTNIPLPPMEVQERIVAELDKINETIGDCRELLRNLDALAQSLFYDYFGDIYTNPKGWVTCKLGDVSEKISNGANTKIELDTYKTEGIMFFRCQNVWRNRFDLSDIVFVDDETNSKMKGSILKHNDLLVTKIGRLFTENSSLGRVALYEGEDYKANLSGNLSFIRLKPIVAPKFILYILISDYFRDYVRNTTSGGIDKRALNNSQLKELQIYLPPLELQEKFAERIEQIEAQKEAVESTIAELQTLLDSRMDYWFN